MSWSITIPFIDEVGLSINEIMTNDEEQSQWFNECIENQENTGEFPEDSITHVRDFLFTLNTEEANTLIRKIDSIVADENKENLLNAIFFPNFGEEEILGDDDDDEIIDVIEEEEEIHEIDGEPTPRSYFLKILYRFKKPLFLSNDIAYLVLKKFGWNDRQASTNWLENQDSILKSLRLKIKSEMVPDLQSQLQITNCGTGKCPICHKEKELLQLYCGHKICQNCLDSEIKLKLEQNKLPFCHQKTTDDKTDCNSEIIIKSLNDPQLFQKYKDTLLFDKLNNNSINVKSCPNKNCGWYLTSADTIGENTGICSHCKAAICFKCGNGPHFPLLKCDQVIEFQEKIPPKMVQLYFEQENWISREERLKEVHCTQKKEISKVLEETIQDLIKDHQKDISNDQEIVKKVDDDIKQSGKDIEQTKKKIREYVAQKKHIPDFSPLTQRIILLHEEIEKKNVYKIQVLEDNEKKESVWKSFLSSAEFDNKILVDGCTSAPSYIQNLNRFLKSQNQHAYEKIEVDTKNHELASLLTTPCPKCGGKATNLIGINQVSCDCGQKICLVCGKAWDEKHQSYLTCPKYMLDISKKDAKDPYKPTDKKFYKQPMPLNKRIEFLLFNNIYAQFRLNKQIYDKMFKEYAKTTDENSQAYNLGAPDEELCPFNRLRRCFEKNTGQAESRKLSMMVLNTVLLAQSTLTWTYPKIYFLRSKNDIRKANEIEIHVLNMRKLQKELIEMINKPSLHSKDKVVTAYNSLDALIKKVPAE
ncbi:hypothetical protein M9Y10_035091 [Tritrichomonas musculus]|uniref:RING-type domain-containing protein n=1 Tax=Tritrichomonas musculus TaxID=1915356 RepID=A0ABR2KGN6_9EUKA